MGGIYEEINKDDRGDHERAWLGILDHWTEAGRVAWMSDTRWAKAALLWEPSHGCRNVGRPCTRWEYALEDFIASFNTKEMIPWQLLAQSQTHWEDMEASFSER